MVNNIVRLSDLLRKDTLTSQEKREAINLAQAMFGTTSRAHGDAVLVALKRKATVGGDASPLNVPPAVHTVIGGGNGTQLNPAGDPVGSGAITDDLTKKEFGFAFAGDTYKRKQDKTGRQRYYRNGKPVTEAVFATALAAANGVGDLSDES